MGRVLSHNQVTDSRVQALFPLLEQFLSDAGRPAESPEAHGAERNIAEAEQ